MYRFQIILLTAALLGALSGSLSAAPDAGPGADEIAADAGAASEASEAGDAGQSAAPDDIPLTNEQIKTELEDALEAYRQLRDKESGVAKRIKWGALASPLLTIAFIFARRYSSKLDAKRKWIPYLLAVLAAAIGLTDHLAFGATWMEAAVSGAWPALSAFIWNLLGPVKKKVTAS